MGKETREYTRNDMKSAMDLIRENPKATIKDWHSKRKNYISEDDEFAVKNVEIFEADLLDKKGKTAEKFAFLRYTGVGGGWEHDAIKRVLALYVGDEPFNDFIEKDCRNPWYRIILFGAKEIPIETPYKEDKIAKIYTQKLSEKSQLDITLCFPEEDKDDEWNEIYDKFSPWDILEHYDSKEGDYLNFVTSEMNNVWFQIHINGIDSLKFKKAKTIIEKRIKERTK